MANKNFQMKANNGAGWDNLFPKTKMEQVEGLDTKMSEVESVAKGASKGKVFETVAELDTWLAVAANKASLNVGDNFYIKDTEVPDFWWDGTQKQELETQKVALDNANTETNGLMSKADYSKLSGIAEGATKVTSPSDIGAATAAQGAKADTALQSVPLATGTVDGLLSKSDKGKLDGLNVVTSGTTAPANPKNGDIWYDYNNN